MQMIANVVPGRFGIIYIYIYIHTVVISWFIGDNEQGPKHVSIGNTGWEGVLA